MSFVDGVRDGFEEDEAEAGGLVFGGVEVAAEFVGGGPEGDFKAKRRAVRRAFLFGGFVVFHRLAVCWACW